MIPSPNFSSRGGKQVRLVVIHTAEGSKTVESLGSYFANPSSQVSSHVGIDDNRIEQYVDYNNAAWTAQSANQIADQAELCGFAAWTREQWLNDHHRMLELAAQWIAERCKARGIPLVKLTPAQLAAGQSGVIGHVDWTVGMKQGTHQDPGSGWPWDVVMQMAAGSTPSPAPAGQTAAEILAANGLGLTEEIVRAARMENLELAAAAAMISKESMGRNVWGHDTTNTAGTYTPGGPVTKDNYLAYRAAVQAGKIGRNGVGPAQCTSAAYQDSADSIGAPDGLGCWDPLTNMRSGFRGLNALVQRYGLLDGARRYNGSGPAAEKYADDFMAKYATWKTRLAAAVEDDDMTPDQDARLARIETVLKMLWEQVAGAGADPFDPDHMFTGWEEFPGGTPGKRTLVDIGRQADVDLNALKAPKS